MALALETQFPFFTPPKLRPQHHRGATEIRFSRWNNANTKKFELRRRTQKELEDRIRFEKRFDSAIAITHNYNPAPPHPTTTYRSSSSTGTPSAPSSPSIPGKASKYSKPPPNSDTLHPAFRTLVRPRRIPPAKSGKGNEISSPHQPNFRIDENGVSYELPEAPFLYQYSYTETPKAKPLKLREPLVSPFGPTTMAKPWLGRKPMAKKALPEFDSFQLPPPQKKGVKPVQAPGPFLPGSGPKYVMSREEIMGEPLTKEEVSQLILSCKKTRRQLNMGRDGLTHNMLDNIHALWKRRRVCKIKCIGVCTVDMDNICQQLEEKTGGKIIYSRGGVLYLFRGRNYNHKTRPRFPLMLWKPATPVYPRLVKHVPEGLTLDQVRDMRKKGRDLTPICKLAKNGLYSNLVGTVREAFEVCELVRINCQGLNPSDFKKIGAKLQTLVPCVLISFEGEHILIWRGREWKSSLSRQTQIRTELNRSCAASERSVAAVDLNPLDTSSSPCESLELKGDFAASEPSIVEAGLNSLATSSSLDESNCDSAAASEPPPMVLVDSNYLETKSCRNNQGHEESPLNCELIDVETAVVVPPLEAAMDESRGGRQVVCDVLEESFARLEDTESQETRSENAEKQHRLDGILLLRKQAIEKGMAISFHDHRLLDADLIFRKAVAFDKTAPVFQIQSESMTTSQKNKAQDSDVLEPKHAEIASVARSAGGAALSGSKRKKTSQTPRLDDLTKVDYLGAAPHGSLRVDELAKLLA